MPRAFGYCRVSTQGQVDSGLGLEAQKQEIRGYYNHRLQPKGVEWGDFYVDEAASGSIPLIQRPDGQRLSLEVEAGDTVVFAKLDRGFRDTVDMLQTVKVWSARGIRVQFLDLGVDTDTDIGRLVMSIMGAIAQFERCRISERIKSAFAEMKRQGRPTNQKTPYGKKIVGRGKERRFVPDMEEREVGKKIVEWHRQGFSFETIFYHLRNQGVRRAKGEVWSVMVIYRAYGAELLLQQQEAASQQNGLPTLTEGETSV